VYQVGINKGIILHSSVTVRLSSRALLHVVIYVVISYLGVKFTLEQATKAQRGSRDLALLFL